MPARSRSADLRRAVTPEAGYLGVVERDEGTLVLVADDEASIREVVKLFLGDEGYAVETAASGEEALAKARELHPDLAVLDISMPGGMDGLEVLDRLRSWSSMPVIFLSARGSPSERAAGLKGGADDYILKPFHADELAARVRAVLRRARPGARSADRADPGTLRFADIEVDFERRVLRKQGRSLWLGRTEWLLLQQLAFNAGKVVLSTELLRSVWGAGYEDDLHLLRLCISRLRRKLGLPAGEEGSIRTYVGVGYALMLD